MDVLLFGREDFVAIRNYHKFLSLVGDREILVNPRPEVALVLERCAKDLSGMAKTNLDRYLYVQHMAGVLSEDILDCVDRVEVFHAACRRAWLLAPADRRFPLIAMRCDSFEFAEPDIAICRKYEANGVIDQLVQMCTKALSVVEAFSSVVSLLGQDIHKLFVNILKARESDAFRFRPVVLGGADHYWFNFHGRGTVTVSLGRSALDLKISAELDRLTGVYTSTSSALFNLGDLLYRVQYFLREVIKRFSTITPMSRFSALLLTCELVTEVLVALRSRSERLGEWSDFMKIRVNYGMDEE
ncbi:hypothetical protein C1886_07570 [Pseudomonas sp. FW300-N1A1]|uniref:hypothetical protein n=1 Tax=Pseudomonas sp. FW300-N1A1 TaxID=2075555 RepID=UPI000CD25A13|nr:hypothetical protein [Pseudomonas sp. FW300-N1A1]POA20831.1 hypothetical protein C1886_07570 [Pseudomonas sp. FW300-N1A1]